MIAIEKGVDIPAGRMRKRLSYPYGEMEVGDSFVVENDCASRMVNVCGMNRKMGLRLGRKFTARKQGDDIRIWRVE
jgi:hypothetical protein